MEKYFNHLRKHGAENLQFLVECLEEMATDFGDDAKGYLVSMDHFHKDDKAGFEDCKKLLAASCARDRVHVQKILKRNEQKDKYRSFNIDDMLKKLFDDNAETYEHDETTFNACWSFMALHRKPRMKRRRTCPPLMARNIH